MPKIIENLRENIITEGKKLLLNKGFKSLSIREIAKHCNIGVGTFYNYFSTKDDLVVEIFRDDWKKILVLIDNLKYSKEPCKEKFRKICCTLDLFVNSYMAIFYELVMLHNDNYGCKETNKFDALYAKTSELIDLERANGNIHSELNSDKLAKLLISNLMYLNKNKYMSFDELYDNLKI